MWPNMQFWSHLLRKSLMESFIFCVMRNLNIIAICFAKNVFIMSNWKQIIFTYVMLFLILYLKCLFVRNCFHDDALYSIIHYIPWLKRLKDRKISSDLYCDFNLSCFIYFDCYHQILTAFDYINQKTLKRRLNKHCDSHCSLLELELFGIIQKQHEKGNVSQQTFFHHCKEVLLGKYQVKI